MTHVRRSVPDLLHQSVAEEIARRAPIPTLFLQEGKKGFVDTESGELSLRRILFPIDGSVPHDKWAQVFRRHAHRTSVTQSAVRPPGASCWVTILMVGALPLHPVAET